MNHSINERTPHQETLIICSIVNQAAVGNGLSKTGVPQSTCRPNFLQINRQNCTINESTLNSCRYIARNTHLERDGEAQGTKTKKVNDRILTRSLIAACRSSKHGLLEGYISTWHGRANGSAQL